MNTWNNRLAQCPSYATYHVTLRAWLQSENHSVREMLRDKVIRAAEAVYAEWRKPRNIAGPVSKLP